MLSGKERFWRFHVLYFKIEGRQAAAATASMLRSMLYFSPCESDFLASLCHLTLWIRRGASGNRSLLFFPLTSERKLVGDNDPRRADGRVGFRILVPRLHTYLLPFSDSHLRLSEASPQSTTCGPDCELTPRQPVRQAPTPSHVL